MAHLVIYSSHFPTPHEPDRDIFTAQLADALSAIYRVSIVCPIPWCPNVPVLRNIDKYRRYAGLPNHVKRGEIDVFYPRYVIVPKTPLTAHAWLQLNSVKGLLKTLHLRLPITAINAHWVFPDGVAATRMAHAINVPILLTALGSDINVSGEIPARRRQIANALKQAAGSSGVSRALCDKLTALGSPEDRTYYLPNGVNKALFKPASESERNALCRKLGLNPEKRYLVFVGRLHPVKGLRFLVEALAVLRSQKQLAFQVLLIGGGESEKELQSMVTANGLGEQVKFVGKVTHSSIREWLQIGYAFCLPSLMEGMPNVILEALACGLPVVASRVGAIPDIVNQSSGILVGPGDSLALASALAEAMGRSWDREKIVAEAGCPDWNEVAVAYSRVIDSIANPASRSS